MTPIHTSHTGTDHAFTLIDISVECRNLPNLDVLSKTDAFCVLYSTRTKSTSNTKKTSSNQGTKPIPFLSKLPNEKYGSEVEVGRTEVIRDNTNPNFTQSFEVEYHFEQEQNFILRAFDEDVKGDPNLSRHDYLGETTFTLGQLMGSRGNVMAKPLGVGKGHVIIKAEEVTSCRDVLHFQFSGKGLKNRDGWMGKSDPFLVISRMNKDKTWNQVWRSEVVMNNLDPEFRMASVPLRTICNGDISRPIQIRIMDWNKSGNHDNMGWVQTTVKEMIDRKNSGERSSYDVSYDKKKRGKLTTVTRGSLLIRQAQLVQVPTFVEYISGGCEISLMVAVDFTASNGDPSLPSSLHYQDPYGNPNEYQSAIQSIGSILQEYDTDKQFPLWGFGGKVDGVVSHCFQIGPTAEVQGVDGMLDAYNTAFQHGVQLFGPTKFSPVIEAATTHALSRASEVRQSYSVLLILTDGTIHDMDETIDMISRAASVAPLSVVIVGVGNADFTGMEALDADEGQLRDSRGVAVTRDIVQFVPFRKFRAASSKLAAETLAEIPGQLVRYFTERGIQPQPMPTAPSFSDVEISYTPQGYHGSTSGIQCFAMPEPLMPAA